MESCSLSKKKESTIGILKSRKEHLKYNHKTSAWQIEMINSEQTMK